ncbi:BTAD domain-containing putative transcriptional regulator [Streptomyces sp. NPDC047841]|uniref:BTAD domain-containing putative transcriptional regulator n=1 Tax=Streptomyces sp. NPDC047841 TaxID=3154708 RepID=UPI003453E50B
MTGRGVCCDSGQHDDPEEQGPEEAARGHVRGEVAEGDATEALRHFVSYRRRLRRELGLVPSTEYRRLLSPYLSHPSGTR